MVKSVARRKRRKLPDFKPPGAAFTSFVMMVASLMCSFWAKQGILTPGAYYMIGVAAAALHLWAWSEAELDLFHNPFYKKRWMVVLCVLSWGVLAFDLYAFIRFLTGKR